MDEQGACERRANGRADLAEEIVGRGSGANHAQGERVLHNQNQHLHNKAQAEAEDKHVHAKPGQRCLRSELGEQVEAKGSHRHARKRVNLVTARPSNDEPHRHTGAQHAQHHRQHHQAGFSRRELMDHLQIRRQISQRTSHGKT